MRKLVLLAVLVLAPVAEAQFPGEFIYPRGYRSSDGYVFDIVDAANFALRVNCVAGTGCTGTGDITSDAGAAGKFALLEGRKIAATTPYAYAFAPTPPLAPAPQFPGTFGYLRGYTDAAGVFGILDSTNSAVRINCVAGCSSAVTIGGAVTGGGANRVLFEDASQNLADDADFTYADDVLLLGAAAAGTNAFEWQKTMAGDAADSNALRITGTFPASLSAQTNFVLLQPTFVTQNQQQIGVNVTTVSSGGNITTPSAAGVFVNPQVGSGTTFLGAFGTSTVQRGVYGQASGASTGNVGVHGVGSAAGGGATTVGVIGEAPTGGNAVGVWGNAVIAAGIQSGGYFTVSAAGTAPTPVADAALTADNVAQAVDIAAFRDNGAANPSTGATATTRVVDGGHVQLGNTVLTSATMTAETQGQARSSVSSYTWSNAQVVALGAGTTGDITVATLPAKTQVRNAYVIITGAAAGPTTVTVSCGDAIGGTPFINYVVASDAKAAANTVYGDAVAERGTSMDVEFYNLPSYTATTLVTCHFISSGGNLDTVTGSTGRVILETVLLP